MTEYHRKNGYIFEGDGTYPTILRKANANERHKETAEICNMH